MWVATQLDHANIQMLLKIYAKWVDGANKSNERGEIDEMFSVATKMRFN